MSAASPRSMADAGLILARVNGALSTVDGMTPARLAELHLNKLRMARNKLEYGVYAKIDYALWQRILARHPMLLNGLRGASLTNVRFTKDRIASLPSEKNHSSFGRSLSLFQKTVRGAMDFSVPSESMAGKKADAIVLKVLIAALEKHEPDPGTSYSGLSVGREVVREGAASHAPDARAAAKVTSPANQEDIKTLNTAITKVLEEYRSQRARTWRRCLMCFLPGRRGKALEAAFSEAQKKKNYQEVINLIQIYNSLEGDESVHMRGLVQEHLCKEATPAYNALLALQALQERDFSFALPSGGH